MATQVKTPIEAAKMLFEEILPNLPVADLSFIQDEYVYYKDSWKSSELVKGDKQTLYNRVLSNLERTVIEPGFHFFAVDLKSSYKVGQIISFSDGDGASVCLFCTADSLYLCGNYFFK